MDDLKWIAIMLGLVLLGLAYIRLLGDSSSGPGDGEGSGS
jgi:hypothetical protein